MSNDIEQQFRERHLAEWPTSPWVQIAHDAWHAYDREATAREYGGTPPKMRRLTGDTFQGFEGLFNHIAREHFAKAQDVGYEGTPAAWRQEVKKHGR